MLLSTGGIDHVTKTFANDDWVDTSVTFGLARTRGAKILKAMYVNMKINFY